MHGIFRLSVIRARVREWCRGRRNRRRCATSAYSCVCGIKSVSGRTGVIYMCKIITNRINPLIINTQHCVCRCFDYKQLHYHNAYT